MSASDISKKENKLIVLVGPTAVGKTAVSVQLAKKLQCPILSSDSRQFFKELNIGTAKPTPEEMDGIPHFFIGNQSITEDYTAGQFEKEALIKLSEIFSKQDLAIVVGGSGLYTDALCNGLDDIPSNLNIRNDIISEYKKMGIDYLENQLKECDPVYHETVDKKNPNRLMRGLEVFRTSGLPYSSFLSRKKANRDFKIIKIGLTMDRSKLYEKINLRVDNMLSDGLEQEAKSMLPFRNKSALNTVGYKELFEYFDGKSSLDEAVELIKRNSRRYAKRQMTWFRRDEDIQWFDVGHDGFFNDLIQALR